MDLLLEKQVKKLCKVLKIQGSGREIEWQVYQVLKSNGGHKYDSKKIVGFCRE